MNNQELQFLSLYELVESHLNPLKMTEELQEQILQSFLFICIDRGFINDSSGETFYSIPYQEITECIFEHNFEISNELNSVIEGLIEPLKKVLKIDGLSSIELKEEKNINSVHQLNAYKRFVSHIELAVCQKKFIAGETLQVALHVRRLQEENETLKGRMETSFSALNKLVNIVEKFNENLNGAKQDLSRVQNEIRDSRQIIIDSVSSAQQAVDQSNTATETVTTIRQDITLLQSDTKSALKEAQKAQKDAEDSKTQFVTILGIFASIIVALFGGMSLVKAAVDLLTSKGSLPLFVFVVSVLMLSFSALIVLLTSWITSLNKQDSVKNYNFTKLIIFCFLIVSCLGSGLISYDLSKRSKESNKQKSSTDLKLEITASN